MNLLDTLLWALATVLTVTLAGGLLRAAIGPDRVDRLSAAMLLGTNGAALLLLLGTLTDRPAFVDAALVLVLLGAVATATFVRVEPAAGERDGRSRAP